MKLRLMLEFCGDFHRYQHMLLSLFFVISLITSNVLYSQTMVTLEPVHWCYADFLAGKNLGDIRDAFKNIQHPSCVVLKAPQTVDSDVARCNHWIYAMHFGFQTVIEEMEWVCHRNWRSALSQTMFYVGSVLGRVMFGIVADRRGRVPVLMAANLMSCIGNSFTALSWDFASFTAGRFIAGMATDSNYVMMYILVFEYIRPTKRTLSLQLGVGLFSCIGFAMSPWLAVLAGTWRRYLLAISVPLLAVPFFYFGVEESALWLISRNNVEAAIGCFERVADFNDRTLDRRLIQRFRRKHDEDGGFGDSAGASVLDMFRTPRLRKLMLILFFNSMVVSLCHDVLSRNVEGFGVSPFLMMSLGSLTILPACAVSILLQDRIGRRAMVSGSLLVGGIFTTACGMAIVTTEIENAYVLVPLSMMGNFGINMAATCSWQYTTELIPTCVRGQGVTTVRTFGYLFTISSSYFLLLGKYFLELPPLILGALCLADSMLVLFLPETLHRTIPCTLAEGEEFGRDEGLCNCTSSQEPMELRVHGAPRTLLAGHSVDTALSDWRTSVVQT